MPDSEAGPPLHVVAVYPEDGAGEGCDPQGLTDCGVPVNGPIEIRFDRYLLPSTVARESLSVYSGSTSNGIFLAPTYDVLERVVSFRPEYGATLVAGVVYQAELRLPGTGGPGFRAFDGAPLKKGHIKLKWSFRTSRSAAQPPTQSPPPLSCSDAVAVFTHGGCAHCHEDASNSPLGLALASAQDLEDTTIARPSHETSSWAIPGSTLGTPSRFGVGMPIIDPTRPATSYLVYKMLENPNNFASDGACATSHTVALPAGECLVAPLAERQRLAGWFVDGDPMPPGKGGLAGGMGDLRKLLDFVERGTGNCN